MDRDATPGKARALECLPEAPLTEVPIGDWPAASRGAEDELLTTYPSRLNRGERIDESLRQWHCSHTGAGLGRHQFTFAA
jgi:hypothetical protein